MRMPLRGIPVSLFCSTFLLIIPISASLDTLNTTQSLKDGEALISAGGRFRMGFFSPGNSKNRYLGIWYNTISVVTVVWVANREIPLTDTSGVLKLDNRGILVLLNQNGSELWSTNASRPAVSPVTQLLDSGNLIVREEGDNNLENSLWQSFDYPCDTFLPGFKLGKDKVTGLDRYLSSWRAPDDPARGNFTFGMDPGGYPEMISREDGVQRYRSGPWNGLRFSGTPQLKQNPVYSFEFVLNQQEVYYSYQLKDSSVLSRLVLIQNGNIHRFIWTDETRSWVLYLTIQVDNCDRYALCGPYGSCVINNSPVCVCLEGFIAKTPNEWNMMNWSNGCVRKTQLNCSEDGFRKYSGIKLPETRNSWFDRSLNLAGCEKLCKKNCTCTAYANLDIRNGGSGCLLWFDHLVDIRQLIENGQDIYIRMAASEIGYGDNAKSNGKSNPNKRIRIMIGSILGIFLIFSLGLVLFVCRKKQQKDSSHGILERSSNNQHQEELPLFNFGTMVSATNNFSETSKLGQGGFGAVYKGILKDGREIAVKRLSKDSRQGLEEFKNEVMHIVKLQHRNLVKLLGCCIEADEKMLIYEFMPNKSLDYFIFDRMRSMILDWPKRYHIIHGIARGLLYLHQDSRLRIIHRDLKASNVLLDHEMNPKISDFGLARSFKGNETEVNTNKVVGTYGYISPEYAIDGLYSVKSDVFSFGVLVLEIVSGDRNRGFSHPDHHLNLLGHAWKLFTEGRPLELIATSLKEPCIESEVLRSIHVALLCVQRNPKDRPGMSSVVLMLGSEGALPQPKQPGFFTERNLDDTGSSSSQNKPYSANDFTITHLEAR